MSLFRMFEEPAGTVKRWRAPSQTTTNDYGNAVKAPRQATVLEHVSVEPDTGSEDTTDQQHVEHSATLYGPPDLDLNEDDQVEWRGARWDVDGPVQAFQPGVLGAVAGTNARLVRRTG